MAGTGGARPGAGRKPNKEKYSGPITRAEKQIVAELPELVKIQIKLAKGGFEVVEERWEPAGTVMAGSGKFAMVAFPNKPADELVCVERKVSVAAPDRAAGQYLIDRIAGKPTQKIKDEDGIEKVSMYGQLIKELRTARGLEDDDTDVYPDNILTDDGAG
jgi:hypothetical protein